jgi:hypothetical protein
MLFCLEEELCIFVNLKYKVFVAVNLSVLSHQPLIYIVQMLPTSFFPLNQITICNYSAFTFCDSYKPSLRAICAPLLISTSVAVLLRLLSLRLSLLTNMLSLTISLPLFLFPFQRWHQSLLSPIYDSLIEGASPNGMLSLRSILCFAICGT